MQRALSLAERGRGQTSPNPMVGAVVVAPTARSSATGITSAAGTPHAEVLRARRRRRPRARRDARSARSSRAAITGRTGPCAERIAAAGITRVVAAASDPNPSSSGRGFAFLRAHGIEVDVGRGDAAGGSG